MYRSKSFFWEKIKVFLSKIFVYNDMLQTNFIYFRNIEIQIIIRVNHDDLQNQIPLYITNNSIHYFIEY